eukprot:Seg17693.2 transcript_id=Seg17693.2/GoldUCD/mRNA.D3Y31 product="putative protein YraH" protein_id=Seg17693.2/GoldUCD/D3Y31
MEARVSIITLGVKNLEKSIEFYRDGLGFPTNRNEGEEIAFFQTSGVCLAVYPLEKLGDDVGEEYTADKVGKFAGVTFAHNTKTKDEVNAVLAKAEKAGAKIVKPAEDTFWGGYSGYFTDPDGYLWEVAYGDCWEFNEDGSLVIP